VFAPLFHARSDFGEKRCSIIIRRIRSRRRIGARNEKTVESPTKCRLF
jgi:hypothetical protein